MPNPNHSPLIQLYLQTYPNPNEALEPYRQLLTEQSNPKTQNLSQLAKTNLPNALNQIFDVELSALKIFQEKLLSLCFHQFKNLIHAHPQAKIFLIGCGASGRAALILEQVLNYPTTPVIAGGDIALINSLPFFEDDPDKAISQLQQQNFQAGDILIGISASGSAAFVNQGLTYAQSLGSPVLRITCTDSTSSTVSMPSLVLITEPPAISGSTRMHPTTLMMLAVLSLNYLEEPNGLEHFQADLDQLTHQIKNLNLNLNSLSNWVQFEADHFDTGVLYNIQAETLTALTIFTDLTERSPTFNLPPLLPMTDTEHLQAHTWPCFTDCETSEQIWKKLIPTRKLFHVNADLEKQALSYNFSKNSLSWPSAHPSSKVILFTETKDQIQNSFFAISKTPLFFLVLKIILNTVSSCVLAKKGRLMGNLMSHQTANNLKLIARAELCAQRYFEQHPEFKISKNKIREVLIQTWPSLTTHQSLYDMIIEGCKIPGLLQNN